MAGEADDDAGLLAAAARGDARSFAVLVRRYIRPATLLATQLLGDQDDAEDVVQVAFTIVYERAGTFDASRAFSPWLYGIVRRLAANRRARDARRARLLQLWGRGEDAAARSPAVEDAVGAALDTEKVHIAMQKLSPMQRACFELVAVRDISPEEVAAMHGITESTVRQHVFRARRALSESLQGVEETT